MPTTKRCTASIKEGTGFPIQGFPVRKPLGGSKVELAIHLFEVNKMTARNFWELSGKK